jgi:hypothetical protein
MRCRVRTLAHFRRPPRTFFLRALGRVLAAVLLLAGLVRAAEAKDEPSLSWERQDWEGGSEFAALAREELGARALVVHDLAFDQLQPEDAVLLLHPTSQLDLESLRRFMKAGGRVVLLDDYGTGDALLAHFGMERVALPAQPLEALRDNPELPVAEPAGMHPVVSEVSKVVLNHATGIRHPDLSSVLRVRAQDGSEVAAAVAGAVGKGRLLAVGDASCVMNSMLRYSGNRNLARGIIRYAVEDDTWGKRRGRLFMVSGTFGQSGGFGSDDALTKVRELGRALSETLAIMRRDGMPPWLAYGLAVALGLGLVVWVGARAGRPHRPVSPRFIKGIPAVAQGGLAGHVAVVGSAQASRMLAMLELKRALEERLAQLLGLDRPPPFEVLLREVESSEILDAPARGTLRLMSARFAQIETMLMMKNRDALARVRDDEVRNTAQTVFTLLDLAESRTRSS